MSSGAIPKGLIPAFQVSVTELAVRTTSVHKLLSDTGIAAALLHRKRQKKQDSKHAAVCFSPAFLQN